jgi:hypothetical protein
MSIKKLSEFLEVASELTEIKDHPMLSDDEFEIYLQHHLYLMAANDTYRELFEKYMEVLEPLGKKSENAQNYAENHNAMLATLVTIGTVISNIPSTIEATSRKKPLFSYYEGLDI